MPFRDWRLELALQGISLALDHLMPPPEPGPVVPGTGSPGYDFSGWSLLHDFGRTPDFGIGGSDYVRGWPDITQGTHFNYPFALAGYPAPDGYTWYVPEFFQNPGTNPLDDVISTWHFDAYETYGDTYTRVSSSQTWARTTAAPGTYPEWNPALDPQRHPWPWPEPFPRPSPMARVREYSKWQFDPAGNVLRGPAPNPRPVQKLNPRPRPPGKGTKERKGSMLIGTLFNGFETFTETVDGVSALYDALPKWLRDQLGLDRDYADLWARVQALYKHWDKLDVQKAVENLLFNNQSDRFVGRFHKELTRARGELGIVTGPVINGLGPVPV